MQYSSEISIPIKFLLCFNADIAVVPEPINGSNIKSAEVERIILSINFSGKGAGWGFLVSCVIYQTSPIELALGSNLNLSLAIKYITS